MSLAQAIARLPGDGSTQQALRDVLVLFMRHQSECMSASDIAHRIGHPTEVVARIIGTLVDTFVLDFERSNACYQYRIGPGSTYEVKAFLEAYERRQGRVQENVARFRQRYGGY